MISPKDNKVDIPIENGFVGMVNRDAFDEWLRERAHTHGAKRMRGSFEKLTRDDDGVARIHITTQAATHAGQPTPQAETTSLRARFVVGADGAKSEVARHHIEGAERTKYVFAYHEIVKAPAAQADYDPDRCDVYYRGTLSPDFYGWVFPHGDTMSIGTGSADKGFSLRSAVGRLRETAGLHTAETLRREGAPIPMKPLPKWDNGKDIILAGDAAGVVAPASGEGIYYAMACGRMAADSVHEALETGNAACLKKARKTFMKQHGTVFWVLGIMQYFWYSNDRRREKFVTICEDKDVQQLTFESYMNKVLVRKKPIAHVRIFFKDLAHLFGLAPRT
ncbi:MAG: geranylgeranyl diphosphate reductase [Betaproteobacteria bacterium]|nr:geranylgeranyl diphosphate reductase [Betaproteobacteria bacterium]